jgi:hypothetical protein
MESISTGKKSTTEQRMDDARRSLSYTKDAALRHAYPWIWDFRCAVASSTVTEYTTLRDSHPVTVAKWYMKVRTD